jgi:lipoate-protein ligase A
MVTKGVASVPSPVRNLKEWSKEIEHERFVEVVAKEFAKKYGGDGEITVRHSLYFSPLCPCAETDRRLVPSSVSTSRKLRRTSTSRASLTN